MFKAVREFVWTITCLTCKFNWSYTTKDEKFRIDRGVYTCPKCGAKSRINIEEN